VPCLQPFSVVLYDFNLEQIQHLAMKYALGVRAGISLMGLPSFRFRAKKPHARLRIGYVSANFGNHPVGHSLLHTFEAHDRSHVEVFCYALTPDDESRWRREYESKVEHFKDVTELNYVDIARLIHTDGIHILVNLDGYTKGARNQIFALQPAPIQVQYLGFLGTMGADFIDYILADAIVCPLRFAQFYSEKIVHLPQTFAIADHKHSYAKTTVKADLPRRAELGLPEHKFVFCCFAQLQKICPKVFTCWCRILKRAPNSVLWLLKWTTEGMENLLLEAEKQGIRRKRFVFLNVVPKEQHIKRCYLADLYLDTTMCSSLSTACDVLWAATPILTVVGQKMSSRTCASALHAVGLDEYAVQTLEAYENTAVKLASDLDKVWQLRQHLEKVRGTCPLFDSNMKAKSLEKGYKMMWRKHEWGEAPDHIKVPEQKVK